MIACIKRLSFLACLLLVPLAAQARPALGGAPLVAVAIPEAADQPKTTVRSLHVLLQSELTKHGLRVKSRPVPRRVSARRRGLVAYARAHRLRRVYELRLRPRGKAIEVRLDEKRGRRMRRAFSARLTAKSTEELGAVVPCLVDAVVARRAPQPPPPPAVVAAAPAAAPGGQGETSAAPAPAEPQAAVAAQSTPRKTEWLWGFSVHPGSFLRAAAGLYGGSAELYYDMAPWRIGLQAGGMGGSGRVLSAGGRGQYLFMVGEKISPIVGASLGFMMLRNEQQASGSGVSFSLSGGAQLSHLAVAKLVAELELILPLFAASRHVAQNDNGIVDLVEHTRWSPAAVAKLSCLF